MVGVTAVRTGEIWLAELDPVVGHEQGGRRPVVVISSDGMNKLPIRMAIVVPLTGRDRGLVTQPRVASPGTGLSRPSFARPEDVRAIDTARLRRQLGQVAAEELAEIRKVLRYFLDL
jgi:mRNA interferase MazF